MTLEIKALRVVSLHPFIHERKSFDQTIKLFKRHDCIFQFLGALQLHIDYLKKLPHVLSDRFNKQ